MSIFRLNRTAQSSCEYGAGIEWIFRRIRPASRPYPYCSLFESRGITSSALSPSIQLWMAYTPSLQTPNSKGRHMGIPKEATRCIIMNSDCFASYAALSEIRRRNRLPVSSVIQYFLSLDQPFWIGSLLVMIKTSSNDPGLSFCFQCKG